MQWRDRKVDCFCSYCIAPVLSPTFSRFDPHSGLQDSVQHSKPILPLLNDQGFLCTILHITSVIIDADWLELPGSLILLLVVAPSLFSDTIRGGIVGIFICLVIGCYLLQEHIRASGGFRNSFTKSNGLSNSIGILLLFVYPVWALVISFI